jgi:hypothetical protein
MEADNLGLLTLFEMAANRVSHLLVKAGEVVRFGKDGFSRRALRIPAG